MCQLCDEETRPKRRAELFNQANDLVRMASIIREIATDDNPHGDSDRSGRVHTLAVHIVKFLAEDWL